MAGKKKRVPTPRGKRAPRTVAPKAAKKKIAPRAVKKKVAPKGAKKVSSRSRKNPRVVAGKARAATPRKRKKVRSQPSPSRVRPPTKPSSRPSTAKPTAKKKKPSVPRGTKRSGTSRSKGSQGSGTSPSKGSALRAPTELTQEEDPRAPIGATPRKKKPVAKKRPAVKKKAFEKKLLPKGKRKRPLASKISASRRKVFQVLDKLQPPGGMNARARRLWQLKVIPELQDLQKKAAQEQYNESVAATRKDMRLTAWRKDLHKRIPSKFAIAFFEVKGEWQQNDDSTFTGSIYAPVPDAAQTHVQNFQDFMLEFMEPAFALEDEPFWWAMGFTVGGTDTKTRSYLRIAGQKYDKIRGRHAIISHWFKVEEQLDRWGQPLRDPVSHKKLYRRALAKVRVIFERWVARNVIQRGLAIRGVTLFAHYGPVKPDLVIA